MFDLLTRLVLALSLFSGMGRRIVTRRSENRDSKSRNVSQVERQEERHGDAKRWRGGRTV